MCERLLIRSSYRCNRKFWCAGGVIVQENLSLDFTEDTWLSHHHIRLLWSIVKGFMFFTNVFDCSVKTDWLAKTIMRKIVLNRLLGRHYGESSVFHVVCFWVYTRTMELLHGTYDVHFLRIPTAFLPRYDPKLHVDYSLKENHFFSEFGPINGPLSNTKFLCKYFDDSGIFPNILLCCLFCHKKCRWTSTKRKFVMWKVSGVSPNLLSRSVTLPQGCNVVNPGKMFHSNSVGSPLISSSSLQLKFIYDPSHTVLPSFVALKMLMDPSKKQHRFWEDVDFHALKIDDFRHQLMTDISMNVFPNNLVPHWRTHLVLPLILKICRTFSSVWDLWYSQWTSDCLGNSSQP